MPKHFYLLAILCASFFFSCENKKEEDNRSIFSYNEMAGVSSLDPANAISFESIWPINQLFNGLVQMDDKMNVIPSIAYKFSISEDGLVYTFNLRNDVFFTTILVLKVGKEEK